MRRMKGLCFFLPWLDWCWWLGDDDDYGEYEDTKSDEDDKDDDDACDCGEEVIQQQGKTFPVEPQPSQLLVENLNHQDQDDQAWSSLINRINALISWDQGQDSR